MRRGQAAESLPEVVLEELLLSELDEESLLELLDDELERLSVR